jgi:hypothetical protein
MAHREKTRSDMSLLESARIPTLRNQAIIGVGLFAVAIFTAYQVAGKIVDNDTQTLLFVVMGFVGCAVAVAILRDWRVGLYWFLGWLTFEDFARKFMGNGLALFFGKDILASLVYISLFVALRHKTEKLFRPPFLIFLSLFFWLGVLQIFNQYSPSIWYGLLGIKTYFYYVPLMYAGYAFVRSDEDLRKFLTWNMVLAGVVAAVGLAQSILGNSFLNPATLAPELQDLGDLQKTSPLTGQAFNLPDAVFVSAGRYAQYLILAAVLALGVAGYLLLSGKRGRKMTYAVTGLLGAAALLSGSRTAFLYVFICAVILPMGFLWGAPWRHRQAHRMVKAIRWSAALFCLGLVIFFAAFPEAMGSRIAYYSETLLPGSSSYELAYRGWQYPIENLMGAFNQPNWVVGNGIGTSSLGVQYVAKLTGRPVQNVWVEEGFGNMIVEMGILAPFLWFLWSGALLYFGWKVVRHLRGTRFFPIALAIVAYVFLLLYPLMHQNLSAYQNYTANAYLWLLVGVLFRLPELEAAVPTATLIGPARPSRGGFQF